MLSCWNPNPHTRPAFSELRKKLEKLLEETRSYIDLSVEVSEDYFNESTAEYAKFFFAYCFALLLFLFFFCMCVFCFCFVFVSFFPCNNS